MFYSKCPSLSVVVPFPRANSATWISVGMRVTVQTYVTLWLSCICQKKNIWQTFHTLYILINFQTQFRQQLNLKWTNSIPYFVLIFSLFLRNHLIWLLVHVIRPHPVYITLHISYTFLYYKKCNCKMSQANQRQTVLSHFELCSCTNSLKP